MLMWTDWSVRMAVDPPLVRSDWESPALAGRNGSASEDPGKRQAILEQAIRTFAELGFRGTDVQVIADRAGVGKGTVYRYFGSKEDLFWATTFEVMLRLDQQVFAAMEGVEGACAKLRAAAIAYAQFFEANPAISRSVRPRSRGVPRHRARVAPRAPREDDRQDRRYLEQGIEAGELRPVDTRQTTIALGCLLYGTTVLGSHLQSVAVTQLAEYAIDIFLGGLRAEAPCSVGREAT